MYFLQYSATIKTAQENEVEIQNSQSFLNKYTVDFTRLHNYLKDEQKFKLENLSIFFTKTDAERGLNITPADFRVLNHEMKVVNPEQVKL